MTISSRILSLIPEYRRRRGRIRKYRDRFGSFLIKPVTAKGRPFATQGSGQGAWLCARIIKNNIILNLTNISLTTIYSHSNLSMVAFCN